MNAVYQHFFYDFDGMLADTYPHSAHTFAVAMRQLRGEEINISEAFDLFNVSYATAFDHYRVTDEEKRFFQRLNEDLTVPPLPALIPHAETVLREAMARGCKNYIYTNRGDFLFQYLDFFGIHDCFTDFIIEAKKPNPASLLAMIERHGLNPSECVVVGDRAIDVEGGRRAGVDGILFNPIGRVKEHCAKFVIRELSELYRFLPNAELVPADAK